MISLDAGRLRAEVAENRPLVEDLARSVLEHSAPEELVLFAETVEEYLHDPRAVLDPPRRDEAIGFGLDVALLTPYVLAVAAPVLSFLLDTVVATAKDEAKPVVADLVRRLFRRSGGGAGQATAVAPAPAALTHEQAARVREVALARAGDLGLPDEQARLLADSVVGALVVNG